MGKSRLDLQAKLEEILGSRNVYFQPPTSTKLQYDCIVYSKDNGKQTYADNKTYTYTHSYTIIVIYRHPDTNISDKILFEFPMTYMERAGIVVDGLYHDYIKLYF